MDTLTELIDVYREVWPAPIAGFLERLCEGTALPDPALPDQGQVGTRRSMSEGENHD